MFTWIINGPFNVHFSSVLQTTHFLYMCLKYVWPHSILFANIYRFLLYKYMIPYLSMLCFFTFHYVSHISWKVYRLLFNMVITFRQFQMFTFPCVSYNFLLLPNKIYDVGILDFSFFYSIFWRNFRACLYKYTVLFRLRRLIETILILYARVCADFP